MSSQGTKRVKKKRSLNGFTREQIDDFQDVFDLFDGTVEGKIRPIDIYKCMQQTGIQEKHPAIYKFMESLVEKNSYDEIDFNTFVEALKDTFGDTSKEETIKNNFELFVEPGEKYIDVHSLKKLAKEMGEEDEEILELLKEVENSGEQITYEEFYQVLSSYKNENK
ncbi:MAG: hypothetical protein MJ252_14420 [archaeon]|nr:hypothetical protein [archaeon]